MIGRERRFYDGLVATAIHELAVDERRARTGPPAAPRTAWVDEDPPQFIAAAPLRPFALGPALRRRHPEADLAA
jgi:hypothetical protein